MAWVQVIVQLFERGFGSAVSREGTAARSDSLIYIYCNNLPLPARSHPPQELCLVALSFVYVFFFPPTHHLVMRLQFRTENGTQFILMLALFLLQKSLEKPVFVSHISPETHKLPKHAWCNSGLKYDFRIK